MADPLSVIAELFAKIVIRTRRLTKQLKDAPKEICRKAQFLDDFHNLCASCQHILLQNSAQIDAHVRQEDVDCIKDLLARVEVEIGCLEKILSNLQPKSSDRRIKSGLKVADILRKGTCQPGSRII